MTHIGLFYVGAVLIINGLALIGVISGRAAAPINLMVGALQVLIPITLFTNPESGAPQYLAAAGILLFGITYLWVGLSELAGIPSDGFGWFSLFVAIAAVLMVLENLRVSAWSGAAQWAVWAGLWTAFFLVLGLGKSGLTTFTGWFAIIAGVTTTGVPGALGLAGRWEERPAVAIGILGVTGLGLLIAGIATRARPVSSGRDSGRTAEAATATG